MNETIYILGHGGDELRRLELQAEIFAPITKRLLSKIGLRRGARVLDIGTGAGDVAMAAAALVGPTGHVLGIDQSATAIERAEERARAARLSHVMFKKVEFPANLDGQLFDLVIGRYVLIHQSDPVTFIRRASAHVDVSGTLAFIEPGASDGSPSWPPVASFDDTVKEILAAFGSARADIRTGNKLVSHFARAGLPEPSLISETPVCTASSGMLEWVARSVDSVRPVEVREQKPWRSLETTMRADAAATNSQLFDPRNVAAWVQIDF